MSDVTTQLNDIKKAEELYQLYMKIAFQASHDTNYSNCPDGEEDRDKKAEYNPLGKPPLPTSKSMYCSKQQSFRSNDDSQIESVFESFETSLFQELEELRKENMSLEKDLNVTEYGNSVQSELLEKLLSANEKLLQDSNLCFSESIRHRYLVMENENISSRKNEILTKLSCKEKESFDAISAVDSLKERTETLQREREEMLLCASHTSANLNTMYNECEGLEILKEEQLQRRMILHKLRQRNGGVRVLLRTRPTIENSCITFISDEKLLLQGFSNHKIRNRQSTYGFHRIFKPDDSISQVYDEVKLHVLSVLDGFNSLVITYGQTGSGKTRTMFGNDLDGGLIEIIGKGIIQEQEKHPNWTFTIATSVFESSGENLHDLVSAESEAILLKDDGERLLLGDQIGQIILGTKEDITVLLETIHRRREIGEISKLQCGSSRSHLLVMFRVQGQNCLDKEDTIDGTLILCDLAGFQDGKALYDLSPLISTQAMSINNSLKLIGDILAKSKQKRKLLFGRSALTLLMKPCLVEDSTCVIILHAFTDLNEIKSTARTLQVGFNIMSNMKKTHMKDNKPIKWAI